MKKNKRLGIFLIAALMALAVGCSEPLSRREQGALIGGSIGAGTGAIIGHQLGHTGSGALIGAPIGLLAGALIGDAVMAEDRRNYYQDLELARMRRELERLRWENERLRDRYYR
jgi:uncharacterized protein YcfJ